MSTTDTIKQLTEVTARRLIEHADSVLVIATFYDSGKGVTHNITESKGNLYANIAAAQEWINEQGECPATEEKPFD